MKLFDKKEFRMIDVFKFIFAIFVIGIHTHVFGSGTSNFVLQSNFYIRVCLLNIAVPFFFICSGFFLFKKMPEGETKFSIVWVYLKRIIIIYIVWSILYLPSIVTSDGFLVGNIFISILIFIYNLLFKYSITHLWYLVSLIFAVAIVALLRKAKLSFKTIVIIGAILFAVGSLNQSYHFLLEELENKYLFFKTFHRYFYYIVGSTRNGLFEGILFVSLGGLFATKEIKISNKKSFVLFLISLVLVVTEAIALREFAFIERVDYTLFLPLPVTFFFIFVASIEVKEDKPIYKELRHLSTLMYLSHQFVKGICGLYSLIDPNIKNIPFVIFLTSTIFTIAFSIIVRKLSLIKKFNFLKYLY